MSKSSQDHPYLHGDAESLVASGGEADSFGSSSSPSTEVIRGIPVRHFTITVGPEAIESYVDPFATQWKITTCSQDSSADAPEDPQLTELVHSYAEGYMSQCLEAARGGEEYSQASNRYNEVLRTVASCYQYSGQWDATGQALTPALSHAQSTLAIANAAADRLFRSMLNICSWQLSGAVQEEYLGILGTNTRYVHVEFVAEGAEPYTHEG